jgi:hypothetical protein
METRINVSVEPQVGLELVIGGPVVVVEHFVVVVDEVVVVLGVAVHEVEVESKL